MHVYFLSSLSEQAATDGTFLLVQNIEDYFITAKADAMAISSKDGNWTETATTKISLTLFPLSLSKAHDSCVKCEG